MIVKRKIKDRLVIVWDDILDTGKTAAALIPLIREHEPSRIITVFLLRKVDGQTTPVSADYCLFDISHKSWVFGYGLDLTEEYRGVPHVCDANLKLYHPDGMVKD
jgi:hypoxanthine phosphoribosyltransferase